MEPSLYSVKAIAILDGSGNRVLSKYYDANVFCTVKEQRAFEKKLFTKTHRSDGEIIMIDGFNCLYKSHVDLNFYVIGSSDENELILLSLLQCLYDSISQLLNRNVETSSLLEHLDSALLVLDEICDNGIILECESSALVRRVSHHLEDIPLAEQSVTQVLMSAREQLKWSMLK